MKRRTLIFWICWLLALMLAAAATPTAKMFQGQVTVMETSGLSILGRAAEINGQWAATGAGTSFFTAWAFPSSEHIDYCQGRRQGDNAKSMVLKSRSGRIEVNTDRDPGINLENEAGIKNGGGGWGVLVFLNQVEKGRCRISDVQVLAPDRIYELGGERLAWLGTADEAQGLEFIRSLLALDSPPDLRKQLVFPIYLFSGPAAVNDLIKLARHDPDTHIRKEAIFWLGQKASAAAVAALGDVLASPEALEIKKAAVFALSQLPEEKGTPLLLQIARRNPQPRLRKEAIFWLGQSGDSRALDFFCEILLK